VAFCQGCGKCVTEKPYCGCELKDDMIAVHTALDWCDAFVIATPIFLFGPSAQTKLLLDRFYSLVNSDSDGHRHVLRGKRMALVMVYGGPDPFASGAMNAYGMFRDMAAFFQLNFVGVVYASAMHPGEIIGNEAALKEAFELGRRLCNRGNGGLDLETRTVYPAEVNSLRDKPV